VSAAYEVGSRLDLGSVDPLTRTQIVRFCGASGDFSPLHTDEEAAQAAGHRSVFAPGLWTMGVAGRLVAAVFGDLRGLGGRFTAIVRPGDELTVTAEVTAVDGPSVRLDLSVTTGDGRTVFTGYAEGDI
jgi:acyl dehydratase